MEEKMRIELFRDVEECMENRKYGDAVYFSEKLLSLCGTGNSTGTGTGTGTGIGTGSGTEGLTELMLYGNALYADRQYTQVISVWKRRRVVRKNEKFLLLFVQCLAALKNFESVLHYVGKSPSEVLSFDDS